MTPFLKLLIEASSLPLQAVETSFAVDSSGFSTCRFVQWVKAKYTDPQQMQKHDWIKVHLMCGVKTNIVTAIEITGRHSGDSLQFKPLVDTTAQNFVMNEVSADKAYLSSANLQTVEDHNAKPYIAFKHNSVAQPRNRYAPRNPSVWERAFHYYSFNQKRFMERYHQRQTSNLPSR